MSELPAESPTPSTLSETRTRGDVRLRGNGAVKKHVVPHIGIRSTTTAVLVLAAGAAALISAASTKTPAFALLLIAVTVALMFPTLVIVASISWTILCRPGFEVLHVSVAGVSVSEMDVLLLLSLISAVRLSQLRGRQAIAFPHWCLILAWPVWMAIRAVIPQQGDVIFASPFVDLHLAIFFLYAFPIFSVIRSRGAEWVICWLSALAYVVCVIAIVSYVGNLIGLVPLGQSSLVNLSPGPLTARPGGELLIVLLGVRLVFSKGPLVLRSKVLSFSLLISELLISQTLTLVLGIAGGVVIVMLVGWKTLNLGSRLVLVLCLAGVTAVAAGAGGGDSRFNLIQRSGENSAQYRVSELKTVGQIIERSPFVLAIGTGPGSLVQFEGVAIQEIKRDTHSVFLTTTLKSGIVGTILFIAPFIAAAVVSIRSRRSGGHFELGVIAGFLIVNVAVPFLWTNSGLVAGIALIAAVLSRHERNAKPNLELRSPPRRSVGRITR